MCGIAGWAGTGAPGRPLELGDHIGHRGPDGSGEQRAEGPSGSWSFFHSRLAIVDLSDAGAQPFASRCSDWVLAFNGEIYNHEDLRGPLRARGHTFTSDMDGEVILHLWEDEREGGLARLNGIFAIALGNTRTGEVVLARDPLGVKPLFHCLDPRGALWFASEPQVLRDGGAPIGSPDVTALAQFLTFLWIPDPRSPWSNVRSVLPGHGLRFTDGRAIEFRYCDLRPYLTNEIDERFDVQVDGLHDLLREATQRQLMSDVPVGLMASGGIDSTLLWWATDAQLARCYTISWAPDNTGEGLDEDAFAVGELSRQYPTPVSFLPGEEMEKAELPRSGDLFADPAFDLTRLIARSAREEGVPVLLSGQGADEVFGGYRRHVAAPFAAGVNSGKAGAWASRALAAAGRGGVRTEYVARLARATAHRDPFAAYMEFCSYSTARDRADALGCDEAEVSDAVVWQRHREAFDSTPADVGLLRRFLFVDLSVYLPGLGLAYVDRAGMEYGVEIRVPWLDLDLVRWSLSLPARSLVAGRHSKLLPRELARRHLPPHITRRPKRGFASPTPRPTSTGSETGFRQANYFHKASGLARSFIATT